MKNCTTFNKICVSHVEEKKKWIHGCANGELMKKTLFEITLKNV